MTRRFIRSAPALAGATAVFLVQGQIARASETVAEAQRLLNRLGYSPGLIDGAWGGATQRALEDYLATRDETFDGTLDENELGLLRVEAERVAGELRPQAGTDIENAWTSFLFPPKDVGVVRQRYHGHAQPGFPADFTGDGLVDIIYVGEQTITNQNQTSATTDGACGGGPCEGAMGHPTLFVGREDGTFEHVESLIIDARPEPGQSLSRQLLVADFNRDGRLDFFIADHSWKGVQGIRDSYFLSQPDGTWLESSLSHLSDPQYRIFDHGGAVGDIDNDGDMDVVLTNLDNRLDCWMNLGDGRMQLIKGCATGQRVFALELGDIDGDGDLDVVEGGSDHRDDHGSLGWRANDGFGRFGEKQALPTVPERFGHVPELSVSDLDGDGDTDIVVSRTGELYVGTAVQVIENRGAEGFRSTLFPLVVAPDDYVATNEGNEWNTYVTAIRFADVDSDGDRDIVLFGGGSVRMDRSELVRASILRNDGDMRFTHLLGGDPNNPVREMDRELFTSDYSVLFKQYAEFPTERRDTPVSNAFVRWHTENGGSAATSRAGYTSFSRPIGLSRTGVTILGYKNIREDTWLKELRVDALVDYGGRLVPVELSARYTEEHDFTGFRARVGTGWGGVTFSSGARAEDVGFWELDRHPYLEGTGIPEFLLDLQEMGLTLVAHLEELPPEKRLELLALYR
jgi:hypothetical protein